jgi:hypothetical protein
LQGKLSLAEQLGQLQEADTSPVPNKCS